MSYLKQCKVNELNHFLTSGSRGWSKFYSDSGALFLRITNLRRDSIILDLTKSKYVALPKNSTEGKRTKVKFQDILISITADLGVIGFIDKEFQEEAYVNQHVALLRIDDKRVCNCYLAYYLAAESSGKLFQRLNDAGAKAGLNLSTIRSFPVRFPDLSEQKKIVKILGTWDCAIETLQTLIDAKTERKRGLMQQLLTGETRLPGFEGEWKTTTVGKLGELFKGVGISKKEVQKSGCRAIRYGELYTTHHMVIRKVVSFVNDDFVQGRKEIRSGDILFACSGETAEEIGKSATYLGKEKCFAGGDIIVLRPKGVDSHFLSCLCNFGESRRYLSSRGQGQSVVHIYRRDLETLPIHLPSLSEQKSIAAIFCDVDRELDLHNQQLEAIREQKRGLMQKLLTGEIIVKTNNV